MFLLTWTQVWVVTLSFGPGLVRSFNLLWSADTSEPQNHHGCHGRWQEVDESSEASVEQLISDHRRLNQSEELTGF